MDNFDVIPTAVALRKSFFLNNVVLRDAPDNGFRYPAGFRIGRIVKNSPAG